MMQELSELMKRFPAVELSYETVHKKVSEEYDVALAIPYGKKSFLWCTHWHNQDVCLLLELGRDRKVVAMQLFLNDVPHPWVYGTVLYGVLVAERQFVVEDVLQCRGILLHKQPFGERLAFFREMMENAWTTQIWLPCMWNLSSTPLTPPYVVHHVQYRSLSQIVPYMNLVQDPYFVQAEDDRKLSSTSVVVVEEKAPRCDFKKPQYKKPTVFYVKADMQFDIYRLYVSDRTTYYGLAYIPNFKTSVLMNGLFRKIRENDNLDLLEESDDEDDFQDVDPTKYVDLEKCVKMECVFHAKFKRWIPQRVVDALTASVVSLTKL